MVRFVRWSLQATAMGAAILPRTALAGWGDENWGEMIWGQTLSVPTLGLLGLGILALALASAAAWGLRKRAWRMSVLLVVLAIPLAVAAGTITFPHTFVNGEVADADEVNANFDAVQAAVNYNDSRITAVESAVEPTLNGGVVFSGQTCGENQAVTGFDSLGNVLCQAINPPNECLLSTDTCSENSTCVDTLSGFTCECDDGYAGTICGTCDTGYTLNGTTCDPNVCTCNHGTGATGIECHTNNTEVCSACDTGYLIGSSGTACDTCDTGYQEDNGECVQAPTIVSLISGDRNVNYAGVMHGYTGGSGGGTLPCTGAAAAWSGPGDPVASYHGYVYNAGGQCTSGFATFDLSSIPDGATILDTVLEFEIIGIYGACEAIDIVGDLNQPIDGGSAQAMSDSYVVERSSPYLTSDFCSIFGVGPTISLGLGASANADIQAELTGDDQLTIGQGYTNFVRTGFDRSISFSNAGWTLKVTYQE